MTGTPSNPAGISEGTPKAVVTDVLGEPTSVTTGAEIFGQYKVVGTVPTDFEAWLYRGTPRGHNTHIAFRGGVVGAIKITPARSGTAFHRIDQVPDVRLAHHTGTTSHTAGNRTTTTLHYDTYPIRTPRPDDGRIKRSVHCGTCRQQVEIIVPSDRLTLVRQRCLLAVPALLLIVGVAVFVYLAVHAHGSLGAILLLVLWTILLVTSTLVTLDKARNAHGVRVARRQPHSRGRRHSIRAAAD